MSPVFWVMAYLVMAGVVAAAWVYFHPDSITPVMDAMLIGLFWPFGLPAMLMVTGISIALTAGERRMERLREEKAERERERREVDRILRSENLP